ncbi:uncharacterized protein RAG0_03866 [Rhynchosporium agropyri]|uniref:Uncharacterized protein n=1 Tax=Rhynchosporium agropyri TaxID=914238 RepID=A0A1E1K6K2_9HELO|nr:uncharacterized protein RAG0_03866 [Rhynchosporium agropyri]
MVVLVLVLVVLVLALSDQDSQRSIHPFSALDHRQNISSTKQEHWLHAPLYSCSFKQRMPSFQVSTIEVKFFGTTCKSITYDTRPLRAFTKALPYLPLAQAEKETTIAGPALLFQQPAQAGACMTVPETGTGTGTRTPSPLPESRSCYALELAHY